MSGKEIVLQTAPGESLVLVPEGVDIKDIEMEWPVPKD